MVTYDVDGAVVTNCVVEFIGSSFANSTTVTNVGTGGSAYNGTGVAADFNTAPTGAKDWVFSGATDKIAVPHGASINNLTTITWEIGFYVSSLNSATNILTGKMNNVAYSSTIAGPTIYVTSAGALGFERDQDGSNYRAYFTNTGVITAGHYYFLQVTWDCTGYAAGPTVSLSVDGAAPTTIAAYDSSGGTVTSWVDDSSDNLAIGNTPYADRPIPITLYVYRLHNVLVSPTDLTTNFNASIWRLVTPSSNSSTWNQDTVPNMAMAVLRPTVATAHNIVAHDVDEAIVTYCVCEFLGASFPTPDSEEPRVITDYVGGVVGAAYKNDYGTNPISGAQQWAFSGASDVISASAGTLDNLDYITLELAFDLKALPSAPAMLVCKMGDAAWPTNDAIGWEVYIDQYGRLTIKRDQYGWVYNAYYTASSTLGAGRNYFLQITWDCVGYANAPVVYLSEDGAAPTVMSLTASPSGTVTAWADDSGTPLAVGNDAFGDASADITLYLLRLHNRILTATTTDGTLTGGDLFTNFTQSVWRYTTTAPVFFVNSDVVLTKVQATDLAFSLYKLTGQKRPMNTQTDSITWYAIKNGHRIITHSTSDFSVVLVPSTDAPATDCTIATSFVVHLTAAEVLFLASQNEVMTHYAELTTGGHTFASTSGGLAVTIPPVPIPPPQIALTGVMRDVAINLRGSGLN